jgi:rhamnulokinase
MSAVRFAAIDLGAESGRGVLGTFDGRRVQMQEVARFPNGPVRVAGHPHWDVLRLFEEIKHTLRRCAEAGGELAGVGVDTWGVDFALLNRRDELIGNPFHYRDVRTTGMLDEAFRLVPKEAIFQATGIQFLPINTLYQLLAMVMAEDPALQAAETLLMMPDLFNFWLCGQKTAELTDATTTQCVDPHTGSWAWSLLERLRIPTRIFPPISPPGSVLGTLRADVADEVGIKPVRVIAPACHDTAAAVAAVPSDSAASAYISSGTWSLVGMELAAPVLTADALRDNLTNEGGVAGTFRLLKNVMGLWLLQECRRQWVRDEAVTFEDVVDLAREARPFGPIVDPDQERFLRPTNMPDEICKAVAATGQSAPADRGALVRCILESLAVKYRWVLDRLEEVTGRSIREVHVVGGGSRNGLLCQLTADATGRVVHAGPTEATAMGNVLVQALALGHLSGLADLRGVVRRSTEIVTYEPRADGRWETALATVNRQLEER